MKKLLQSLSATQRITILVCAVAVAAGVMWFSRFQQDAGMRPLYTGLSAEDASAMVAKLRENGVVYKVGENGTSLMVPEARVAELRLEMAGIGLPKTGRIGFEIFDKTNFGITDFAEHVNYRRAVEGELERSVMALAEVQQARVHVSLPKESVFTESRESAKASVLVGLRPGMRLSAQNVTAIANLVSSAVEGLAPESVSVVDMAGNLLSRPRRDGPADGAQISEAALEYRQAIEHDLALKINNTLDPLLGADKFRTGVSADVDMSSGEQSEETYDPTKSVMVSSQKSEDSSGTTRASSGAAAQAAAPGTAANLPPTTTAKPGGGGSTSTKRSESIAYQSSRVTKHVKLPQGSIKRLSIAVLVDQGAKWEGQGKNMHRVVTPPDTAKLKTIQSVVSALVGLNTERGDQITVEALPFDSSVNMELPPGETPDAAKPKALTPLEALKQKPMILYGSAGGAVFVIGLVVFALTRGKKKQMLREMPEVLPPATTLASLPAAAAAQQQAGAIAANETPRPALMPSRTEVLLNQLQESGRNNPEAWAGVLRGWLSEEEAHS
ncbi:MAG TPA: flagellar basal-body MS-ring/collar protein FliF [Bryobacteraceae bacterium]|nr:flagellar basal-body MS-ring/collar protein FliF [Bryobacteraceae bacterium]